MKYYLILLVILVAGCATTENQLVVEKLGNSTHNFSFELNETLEIHVDSGVKERIEESEKFAFIYNYTGEHVNDAYRRSAFNIVQEMTLYREFNNRTFDVEYYGFDPRSGLWHDTEGPLTRLNTDATRIWFRDSSAGAEDTSITFEYGMIFINGIEPRDVVQASERFILIFLSEDDV